MNTFSTADIRIENGVPFSNEYEDVYHSRSGGLAQSRAVFLAGNGLPERWLHSSSFQILETGFGAGFNFIATWESWQKSVNNTHACLHYVALDKHPLLRDDLERIWSSHPEQRPFWSDLINAWPPATPGHHHVYLNGGRLHLMLVWGDISKTLPDLAMAADAFFLDGFAPGKNPDMWSMQVMQGLARQARRSATLASWCVAGDVRKKLEKQGFRVWRSAGFGGKRHRLEGVFDRIPGDAFSAMTTPARNPVLFRSANPLPRKALVIGAGIAGCLISEHLVRRGWSITLLDRHGAPAGEASGNPAGIVRPAPSLDDNFPDRLTRTAFLHTLGTLKRLSSDAYPLLRGLNGVVMPACDAEEHRAQLALMDRQRWYEALLEWLPPGFMGAWTHRPLAHGGWHIPLAGWINPIQYCQAAITSCGPGLSALWRSPVARLTRPQSEWLALDPEGGILASAPVAILALGAQLLEPVQDWTLDAFRGQVTCAGPDPFPPGSPVICQSGYLIPGLNGQMLSGASYDRENDTHPDKTIQNHNLERIRSMQPGWMPSSGTVHDRVGFRAVARDRMPIVGAVPDHEQLYSIMGLGSRGLTWGSLMAELLAALLNGEPLPLERSLVGAMAPHRSVISSR